MTTQILIYKGPGANFRCLRALKTELRPLSIKLVGPADLAASWEDQTALLIFAGGRDVPYHDALKGPLNRRIRTFVEKGGNYLGICAGGYYGSQSVQFEMGQPLEVSGQRELAFFPGTAEGPAYGKGQFCYESEKGARIAPLSLASGELSAAYFNGGCSFSDAALYPSVNVLAHYRNLPGQPAALIECRVGKGLAILSGVHPEYTIQTCEVSEKQRKELFKALLNRLL